MSFLARILEEKRRAKMAYGSGVSEEVLRYDRRRTPRDFLSSLVRGDISIIAEVKRASPSAGTISETDALEQALKYQAGGADAVSVLTEPIHFRGSISDLARVAKRLTIPVMRKDFIVSDHEILETFLSGADSFLLIAEAFESDDDIEKMITHGRKLGMEPILEFFSEEGARKAVRTSARIVGINSRNLHSLVVDLENAIELFEKFRKSLEGRVIVAESGIKSKDDILSFVRRGIKCFLIGEALMRADDPHKLISEFKRSVCFHNS